IFVTDLLTNTTRRASVSSSSVEGSAASASTAISADGRYIVYRSSATNLVAGDTNGVDDIFMFDMQTATTTRVNVSSSGAQATTQALRPSISGDGRYVTFHSDASNLVSGDTNGVTDIFVRDLLTGTTRRVSVNSSGVEANGASLRGTLSADGRFIAFVSSASNLVSGDTNGVDEVFVHDLLTGSTSIASTDTNGTFANAAATGPQISADGQYVAWASGATNLISGDTNGTNDIYRAQNTVLSYAAGIASGIRPLAGFSLSQVTLARTAQSTLDKYLSELNIAAGNIGASMSRISSAISNLTIRTENIAAAASRILDTDVATDSAELVRANILQNASAAVLAQANLSGSLVLRLLEG
ncbi:MAG: PD40 domain-containing protein, partial [Deltaproteobacteria bacterium]|nr:PD40 domain-containing protein [Deltaproteobacteria bacterium]